MARSWNLFLAVLSLIVDMGYSSSLNRSSSLQTLEFWQKIDFLCNAASICREEFTSERNTTAILGNGQTSCCKDCSCSINCGLQSNCCFKDDGNDKLISRSEQECLFPKTVQPKGKDKYSYISYYMFTKHPGNTSLNKRNIRTCGNMDTSSMRSLAPLYSKSTGRIYKNVNCANEFGINDGILWGTQIYCRKKYDLENRTVYFRTLDDVLFYLERYGKAPGCEYNFIYPGDMNDLISEQCYQDLIESCEEDDFEVPIGINLAPDMVKKGCESGPFAPYVLTGQGNNFERLDEYVSYRNIFCAICNGYNPYDKDERYCTDPSVQNWRTNTGKVPFVLLLDSAFVNKENSVNSYPIACKSNNGRMDEDNCRSVFCPTAQYRKIDGSCSFAVSQWIATRFTVTFKLIFKQSLRKKDVIGMQYSDITYPLKWSWEIIHISISYKCDDGLGDGTDIISLLIMIGNVFPMSRASRIISDIEQVMSKDWIVNVNGSKIQASVTFFSGIILCSPTDTFCLEQLQERNITRLCRKWILHDKAMDYLKSNVQVINILFYCDQVSLHKQEYEMVSTSGILDKMSGKIFFYEEFAMIYGNSEEEYVRICVKESVFKRIDDLVGMAFTNIPDAYIYVVLFAVVNIKYIYLD